MKKILLFLFVLWGGCFAEQKAMENGKNTINALDGIKANQHSIVYKDGKVSLDVKKDINFFCSNNGEKLHNKRPSNENNHIISISANYKISYLWVYNASGFDSFILIDSSNYVLSLPEGEYSFFAGYYPSKHQHHIIIHDSIAVNSNINLNFEKEKAIYTTKFEFLRENNIDLRINALGIYFFNGLCNSNFRMTASRTDSLCFQLHFNKISEYFTGEWCVKGKQSKNGGALYLLNNKLPIIKQDTIITNDPIHLASADLFYHVPDSIETQHRDIQLMTFQPEFHHWGPGDLIYRAPFNLRVFQDTTAEFSLITSTFFQVLKSWPGVGDQLTYVTTPEIKIRDQKVSGFFYRDRYSTSFTVSENTTEVHLGLAPTYWFGKFNNKNDSIKIESPYGYWTQLFLAQANDILAHYPIKYKLFYEDSLIKSSKFIPTTYWYPYMIYGFHPDSLNMSATPGKHQMYIVDDQNQVAGFHGKTEVITEFDLSKADKNPPNITLFQIIRGDILTNEIENSENNQIRFIMQDDVQLDSVRLFYRPVLQLNNKYFRNDTTWKEFILTQNAPYWKTEIPELTAGYYTVKLVATDNTGNFIHCIMQPAFKVRNVNRIESKDKNNISNQFQLLPNYPNPFNSATIISWNISSNYNDKIEINIFNLLGQNVYNLYNSNGKGGIHKQYWNGTNQNGEKLSTGIYIVEMRGGDRVLQQKILLIK